MFEMWERVKHQNYWKWTVIEKQENWIVVLFDHEWIWLRRVPEETLWQYREFESFHKKESREQRIEEHKRKFVIVGLTKEENKKRMVAYTARPFNS